MPYKRSDPGWTYIFNYIYKYIYVYTYEFVRMGIVLRAVAKSRKSRGLKPQ